MNAITPPQIRALRAAASKVFGQCACRAGGVCDYHDWLAANFEGLASTKDLDVKQATAAITFLRKSIPHSKGNRSANRALSEVEGHAASKPGVCKRHYTGSGKRNNMKANRLTQNQAGKIGALADLMGWNPKRVRGFIHRQTRLRADVQMLRNYQAGLVIVGMQKIASCNKKRVYSFLNTATQNHWQTPRGQRIRRAIQKRLGVHHGPTTPRTTHQELAGSGSATPGETKPTARVRDLQNRRN